MDMFQLQTHAPTHLFETKFGLKFTAACIGGRDDWSLKHLYRGDAEFDQELALDLGQALAPLGAEQVYAPTPGFNAAFIDREKLTEFVHLERNFTGLSMRAWRNKMLPADCAPLYHPGAAGIFSAGGCPVVVATHGRHAVFAHAGLKSVLDPALVQGDIDKRREHESVANTVMWALHRMEPGSFNPREVEAWVLQSIRPQDFVYKFHEGAGSEREFSQALWEYASRYSGKAAYRDGVGVYLDIPEILRDQFLDLKVPAGNIHIGDFSYLPANLPTTRNGGGARRYLAAVVRTQ